jgi:hypothetical protein
MGIEYANVIAAIKLSVTNNNFSLMQQNHYLMLTYTMEYFEYTIICEGKIFT